jgi:hypothetical protein
MNITGMTGVTAAQKVVLKALGAVEHDDIGIPLWATPPAVR